MAALLDTCYFSYSNQTERSPQRNTIRITCCSHGEKRVRGDSDSARWVDDEAQIRLHDILPVLIGYFHLSSTYTVH